MTKRLMLLCVIFCLSVPLLTHAQTQCDGTLVSRLSVGSQAKVTAGAANNVRSAPSINAEKIGEISGDETIVILEGPTCADNFAWYKVQASSVVGWTVESVPNGDTFTFEYTLEPVYDLYFDEQGISFEVPRADMFYSDKLILETITASAVTPDVVRIADESTGAFELDVMSAAQIERRQPGVVEALQSALFSEAPDDFQRMLTARTLSPFSKFYNWSELELDVRSESQIIEVETGKFYRFLMPFRIGIAYVAFGLLQDGEFMVSTFVLLPFESFNLPYGSFEERLANLNNLASGDIAPYLQVLDQTLQSLGVNADTLQAVTDAALTTSKPPICGLYPPRLWVGESALSEFSEDSLRIRDAAGGATTGELIEPRGEIDVLEGPVCVNNVYWWKIRETVTPFAEGWVAETDENGYFLTPIETFEEEIVFEEPTNPLPTPTVSVVCNITFIQQSNVRIYPDGATEPYGYLESDQTVAAVGQYERQGEGFRWWKIDPAVPISLADSGFSEPIPNAWVREDFVRESGDCANLPMIEYPD